MKKYNAVAFSGRNQMFHLTTVEYSSEMETFIKSNEQKGYKVLVDYFENGRLLHQIYFTK